MKLITVSFLIVNKGIEDKKEDGEEVGPSIDLEEVDNEVNYCSFSNLNKGIEDKKEDGEEVVPSIDLEEVDNEVKEGEKRDTEEDEEFEGQEEEEDMEVHSFACFDAKC